MSDLFDAHIELVQAVNNAKTEQEHWEARLVLRGFRTAVSLLGIPQLCECDNFYLEQGIDRPMCCGVFLDWEPTEVQKEG